MGIFEKGFEKPSPIQEEGEGRGAWGEVRRAKRRTEGCEQSERGKGL